MQINLNIFALNYFIYNFVPLISQIYVGQCQPKRTSNSKKIRFSEEQVSTYLGVTRSVLRKYESNTDSIPFDVFDKLSNLYGVDMSVFFEENMDDFQQSLVCAFRTDGITLKICIQLPNSRALSTTTLKCVIF